MIVVEGPDGAGKTQLINRLSSELGLPISPKVVDSDTRAMVNLKTWVDDNLAKGFQHTLFDRHRLISEPIYGTVMPDRVGESGFWDRRWLTRAMQKFCMIRPMVIYCLPPVGEVVKNIANDPNNAVIRPHILRIYRAYLAVAIRDNQGLVWDYTGQEGLEIDAILFAIGRTLNRREYPDV